MAEECVIICDKDVVLCERCGWFGEMQACTYKKGDRTCPACAGGVSLKEKRSWTWFPGRTYGGDA